MVDYYQAVAHYRIGCRIFQYKGVNTVVIDILILVMNANWIRRRFGVNVHQQWGEVIYFLIHVVENFRCAIRKQTKPMQELVYHVNDYM